jgi:hypothetical protein
MWMMPVVDFKGRIFDFLGAFMPPDTRPRLDENDLLPILLHVYTSFSRLALIPKTLVIPKKDQR